MTQCLPSRAFMIDMTQEDINSILEVVEEPCVAFEAQGTYGSTRGEAWFGAN
jgi:hypothetical protein